MSGFSKFKKAAKKAAKKVGRAPGAARNATISGVRRAAKKAGEETPGFGSYAKTMKKLTREGKNK